MSTKGIRYEKFKDEKVQEVLEKRDKLVKEGKTYAEEAEKKLGKLQQEITKLKDKARKLVDPYVSKMDIGEFEIPTEVKPVDGEIQVQIVDQIESYKDLLRKKKEDELTANSDTDKKLDKGTA